MKIGYVIRDEQSNSTSREEFRLRIAAVAPEGPEVVTGKWGFNDRGDAIDERLLDADTIFYHCGDANKEDCEPFVTEFSGKHTNTPVVLFSGGSLELGEELQRRIPSLGLIEEEVLQNNLSTFVQYLRSSMAPRSAAQVVAALRGTLPELEVALQVLYGLLVIHLYREVFRDAGADRLQRAGAAAFHELKETRPDDLETALAIEVATRIISTTDSSMMHSGLSNLFPGEAQTICKQLAQPGPNWTVSTPKPSSLGDIVSALTAAGADDYWDEYLTQLRDLLLQH